MAKVEYRVIEEDGKIELISFNSKGVGKIVKTISFLTKSDRNAISRIENKRVTARSEIAKLHFMIYFKMKKDGKL